MFRVFPYLRLEGIQCITFLLYLLRVFIVVLSYILDFPCLEDIIIKYRALYKTSSLTLSSIIYLMVLKIDLPKLKVIECGDYSFHETSSLTLTSM